MIFTILQVQSDSIVTGNEVLTSETSFSIWFWIALVEFLIIIALLLRFKKKDSDLAFGNLSKSKIHNAKNSDVDMDNLMQSINSSKGLYKELSRKCHPDRFINTEKHKVAEGIFQNISKYRRDYSKLILLKQQAITELNIDIK